MYRAMICGFIQRGDARTRLILSNAALELSRGRELHDLVNTRVRGEIQLVLLREVAAISYSSISWQRKDTHSGTKRPPSQCRPPYARTPSFGAVRLTSTTGSIVATSRPSVVVSRCRPSSTFQPEGMSTDTMGVLEAASASRISSNGARTGGWNEKPGVRAEGRRGVVKEGKRACSRMT